MENYESGKSIDNFAKKNQDNTKNYWINRKYKNLVAQINELEKDFKILTDTELRIHNFQLQTEYKETKNLNNLITRSFALTREVSFRALGLRHFDVQLLAGLVLNNNKIAEMNTGEGKTLVATLSASLNALTKEGVHIITVNDYLANRDQVAMGQIYRSLGFDTGLIQTNMTSMQRKLNYQADITYVTNTELTFDYLRDNSTTSIKNVVLRQNPFNYGIIDEVDSVLIDEAQTPLIIAIPTDLKDSQQEKDKYLIALDITNYLEFNIDYKTDEKNRNVTLTESGNKIVEKLIEMQNLYDPGNPWMPYIKNALLAKSFYTEDINYIVDRRRVMIIDEFTGRLMPDRRWGDGLHQAIEAKENVPIRPKTQTQASITYQCFFELYPRMCGMSGTAKTSELEFEEFYNLSVEIIPTNRPMKRKDLEDIVYVNQFAKWNGITNYIYQLNTKKYNRQPILVGTKNIQKSEMLAALLNEYGFSYQILNAKPDNARRESEIIAQAGKQKSITIATNMAGRGTDIILGGNINFQVEKQIFQVIVPSRSKFKSSFLNFIGIVYLTIKINLVCRKNQFEFLIYKIIFIINKTKIDKYEICSMSDFLDPARLEIYSEIRFKKYIENVRLKKLSILSCNIKESKLKKLNLKKFRSKIFKKNVLENITFSIYIYLLIEKFFRFVKLTERLINQKKSLKFNKILSFININGRIELKADPKRDSSHKFLSILLVLIKNRTFLKLSNVETLELLKENERILNPITSYQCSIRFLFSNLKFCLKNLYKRENEIVKKSGGLFVIGTEKNNSVRIDNQLRGRCGRQGDPGTSLFFLSIDDDIFRLFGGNSIKNILKKNFDISQDKLTNNYLMQSNIEYVQRKVEENSYQQRKILYDYDKILNSQRRIIYYQRNKILYSSSQPTILGFVEFILFDLFYSLEKEEIDLNQVIQIFESLISYKLNPNLFTQSKFDLNNFDVFEIRNYLSYEFWLAYQARLDLFAVHAIGLIIFRDLEKVLALSSIDLLWKQHLERMITLRDNVCWRAYANRDPYSEYLKESFSLFTICKDTYKWYTIFMLFKPIII